MKRIVLSIVVLLVLLCGVAVAETTIIDQGNCGASGSNVTWTLDSAGTLTISGKGKMGDFSGDEDVPWASYCESIRTVAIGTGVTSIGDGAFSDCSNLSSVTIPAGVTEIGDFAFIFCYSLGSIELPEGLRMIGESAFVECYSLSSVKLPQSLTTIGSEAFFQCISLSSINIPTNVTDIGDFAFHGCELTSIVIPDGVTRIGEYAFHKCTELNNIVLSDKLTTIGEGAFSACWSLTSVTIPKGITSIGSFAFEDCSSLEKILFRGRNSISIGDDAIPSSVIICCYRGSGVDRWATENGYTVEYLADHTHTPVTDPAVPATHVTTGLTEGSHCSVCGEVLAAQQIVPIVEVEKVVLPAGLKTIEEEAFAGGTFACVVLPEGCKAIGAGAFKNCAQLRFIEIPESVDYIDGSAFDGCSDSLIIVTTSGSVAEDFANRNNITCVTLD